MQQNPTVTNVQRLFSNGDAAQIRSVYRESLQIPASSHFAHRLQKWLSSLCPVRSKHRGNPSLYVRADASGHQKTHISKQTDETDRGSQASSYQGPSISSQGQDFTTGKPWDFKYIHGLRLCNLSNIVEKNRSVSYFPTMY